MKIDYLRKIAEEAKHHPNYRFKDKSEQDLLALAKRSFSKLTKTQKEMVFASWQKALKQDAETTLPKELQDELPLANPFEFVVFRFLAQTNLYFLCHLLEKYSETTIDTHEEICNAFFVQKDPTYLTWDEFAHQYTDLKDRMLLVPRGGFKSSMNIVDCVQWILCYPEVTILILTGVYKLASDFVGELKLHFTLDELPSENGRLFGPRAMMNRTNGEWSNNLFQVLFPEHCIPAGEGNQFEFQTPSGGDAREPSVRAASIEQALSGMHFCVLKLDDVVTNENSLTMDRLEKVNKQISVNRAMLHPHGFNDVIGTWYDEFDYYGKTIRQEESFALEEGRLASIHGSVDSGRFNSSVDVKVYLRSAWWPNELAQKQGKIESELLKTDYELWFPERLTYEFLLKERKKDVDGFAIKYLNNPRKIHRVKFPRELLVRRTIADTYLPQQGIVVTAVDTAYSTKQWADYTVAITALISGGRFYVLDMTRGRYSEYDLPAMLAALAFKWKPKRLAIEDSVGVKWMGRELRREMDKLQISVPVEYINLGYGSKLRSKQLKAKPVLRLLGDERLFFRTSCQGIEDIYSELEKFTGTSDDKHDDIVSALSLLVEQFGAYADVEARTTFAATQYTADHQSKDRHDMIYGLGRYARYNATEDHPATVFQIENSPVIERDYDPLSDLMG